MGVGGCDHSDQRWPVTTHGAEKRARGLTAEGEEKVAEFVVGSA